MSFRYNEPGYVQCAQYDSDYRRAIWYRKNKDDSIEVCAGREGDDDYVKLVPGEPLTKETMAAIGDILATGTMIVDERKEPTPLFVPIDAVPTGEAHGLACGPAGSTIMSIPTFQASREGTSFRNYREQIGLTMGDAARALGIDVATMSALETGAKTLTFDEWIDAHFTVTKSAVRKIP